MERNVLDPIHLPCPDMAGCANPNPALTAKSRSMVAKLKAQLFGNKREQSKHYIPERFRFARRVEG